jgi:hypothetical protein
VPTVSAANQGQATRPPNSAVHASIQRASAATGVDFRYLVAQAKLESGLDPAARAGTSSAAGLYQFINSTWLETVDRHGANHGLGWADAAITRSSGRAEIADPTMRAQVLALRHDPDAASLMAAELTRDNIGELQAFLGRAPDNAETYLAHFMGAGGAKDFLSALHRDPSQVAAAQFPQAAGSNRAIFYDNGRARSLGEVMELMQGKVANAMSGTLEGALPYGLVAPGTGTGQGPGWQRFAPPADFRRAVAAFDDAAAPRRASMADTLRSTFGGNAVSQAAAARVSDAYSKFRAFDL